MKFECSRDNFYSAMSSAARSVGSKTETDLSAFVLIRIRAAAEKTHLEVLSFNRVSVSQTPIEGATCPAGQQSGHFTVDAHALLRCLQSVPDGDSTVTVSYDGKFVSITAGLWVNHLPCRGAELWPFWDDRVAASRTEATLEIAPFVEALSRVALFASRDETHEPNKCAVYCWDGRVDASSSLGYGIAIGPFTGRFIIPTAAIKPLSDFLRTSGTTCEVSKGDDITTFRREDGGLFGVLVQPGFKEITSHPIYAVDDPVKDSFTASRDQVRRALDFLFTAASPTEKMVGFHVDPAGKVVHLSAQLRATSKDHSIPVSVEAVGSERRGKLSKEDLESVLAVWSDPKVTFDIMLISKPNNPSRVFQMLRVSEPQVADKPLRYVYLLNGGQG